MGKEISAKKSRIQELQRVEDSNKSHQASKFGTKSLHNESH